MVEFTQIKVTGWLFNVIKKVGSGRGLITNVWVSVGVLHAFSTDRIRSYTTKGSSPFVATPAGKYGNNGAAFDVVVLSYTVFPVAWFIICHVYELMLTPKLVFIHTGFCV